MITPRKCVITPSIHATSPREDNPPVGSSFAFGPSVREKNHRPGGDDFFPENAEEAPGGLPGARDVACMAGAKTHENLSGAATYVIITAAVKLDCRPFSDADSDSV